MYSIIKHFWFVIICLSLCTCSSETAPKAWTFVSMPDFLNVDCDYPQIGWEESLEYILTAVKKEDPDFLMVPGDLVMGHWDDASWNSQDTIEKYADRYYSAWKSRMNRHELAYYTAVGDHELGDNPWRDTAKVATIPFYRAAFRKHLQMPLNGPWHLPGTAFWWKHKGVLFISVDVFEDGESDQGAIKAGVSGKQLRWMEDIFLANQDAKYRIVMGHTPILGPVRKWSSSGLMIKEGRDAPLWQCMKKYNVDAYLCGEVHAITCTERDNIMQIAHGGLIGYNTRTNYLVVTVEANRLTLEIKEIELMPSGDHLWQTKNNRPLKRVDIVDPVKGFYTIAKAVLVRDGPEKFIDRIGYFKPEYEFSTDQAAPIFRKGSRPGIVTELPKIIAGQ
ncbi:MAG: metallophosphoesterase [Saprospiraceae bacterium]|nr:metallophosphoesterase [Saprospiraceae bacterium]